MNRGLYKNVLSKIVNNYLFKYYKSNPFISFLAVDFKLSS